jgi:hypothetical protein
MEEKTIEVVALRAGLERALAQLPDDVAAARRRSRR